MRKFIHAIALLAMAGCGGTITSTGYSQSGAPISGQITATPPESGLSNIQFLLSGSNGQQCTGTIRAKAIDNIYKIPLQCDNGSKGTATLTDNNSALTTTADYRLSTGERGRIVFGGASNEASPALAQAGYDIGYALGGGTTKTSSRKPDEVICTGTPPYVRCRSY
jgi:hypothetical protein